MKRTECGPNNNGCLFILKTSFIIEVVIITYTECNFSNKFNFYQDIFLSSIV